MSITGVSFGNTVTTKAYGVYKENPKRKNNIFEKEAPTGMPPEVKAEYLARLQEILDKKGKIDPRHDKVFYNPQTGELDTWKPGIYDPNKKDTHNGAKVIGGLVGAAAALALAFIFRGKIKAGAGKAMEAAKPLAEKALTQGKALLTKGTEFAKGIFNKGADFITGKGGIANIIKDGLAKAKGVATKGVDFVIGKGGVVNMIKDNLAAIKNMFKKVA